MVETLAPCRLVLPCAEWALHARRTAAVCTLHGVPTFQGLTHIDVNMLLEDADSWMPVQRNGRVTSRRGQRVKSRCVKALLCPTRDATGRHRCAARSPWYSCITFFVIRTISGGKGQVLLGRG